MPLWNSSVFGGQSWVASERMIFFYPPTWILWLLPTGLGLTLLLASHLAAAGLTMFVFLRSLGRTLAPSLLGGWVFLLCGQWTGRAFAGHLDLVLAAPYLPLIALGTKALLDQRSTRAAIWLGLSFVPLVLLGALQLVLFCAYASLGVIAWTWTRGRRRKPEDASPVGELRLRRAAGLLAVAALVAACVSAVRALPLLSGSQAWPVLEDEPAEFAATFTMATSDLPRWIVPDGGHPPEPGASDLRNGFFWEITPYVGVLPLALALLAGFVTWRTRETKAWLALLAMSLLYALAVFPVFPILVRLLPGLGSFGVAARALMLSVFALAALAGLGLEVLLERRKEPRVQRSAWTVVALLILSGIGLSAAASEDWIPSGSFLAAGSFLVLSAAVLTIALSFELSRSRLGALVCAATVFELGFTAWPLFVTAPAAEITPVTEKLLSEIQADPGRGRLLDLSGHLPQEVTAPRGIDGALGYEPRVPKDFLPVFNRAYEPYVKEALEPRSGELERVRYHQVFDLLGVRFVTSLREIDGAGLLEPVASEVLEAHGSHETHELHLYRNMTAMPRAYLVPEVRIFEAREKILEELVYIEPKRYACLEASFLEGSGLPNELLEPAQRETFFGAFEEVPVHKLGPDRVRISLELERPRYLILTGSWDPGWRANDQGRDVPILRANYCQQALFLEKGLHELELSYEPWSYRAGLWISGASLALLIAFWLVANRRARRHEDEEASPWAMEEESDEESAPKVAHQLS
ncbi:MAG: hypothetical protein RL885_16690 [Planctomycetota bacterium]